MKTFASSIIGRHTLTITALPALGLATAMCSQPAPGGPNAPDQAASRPVAIEHEPCDIESTAAVKFDVNNDGRADITDVRSGERIVCRAVDFNFDGRVDNFLYFDDSERLRRRESDFDIDGLIDEIAIYQRGEVIEKHRETNLDAKLDTWDFYKNGQLASRERDTTGDGRVDQWWTFPDPKRPDCPLIAVDQNGDGRPDTRQDVCADQQAEAQTGESAPQQTMDAGAAEAAAPANPSPEAGER